MAHSPLSPSSLRVPVICAPMNLVSGPELVAAACVSGIMGVLPRHNAESLDEFEEWLDIISRARAEARGKAPWEPGPLAVNFATRRSPEEIAQDLRLCEQYGVSVIINAMGDPTELARIVHDWGGQLFHDVTAPRFAKKAMAAGVDGMIVIISGGGGHSGTLSAFSFLPQLRDEFDGVLVLAGGLSTGDAVLSAQALGAEYAYMGTRFIATQESRAATEYKNLLVHSTSHDLIFTSAITAVPANWLTGSLERVGLNPSSLEHSSGRGNYDHLPPDIRPWRDIWSAGQGIDLIHDIPSVADLVSALDQEYKTARERISV